MQSLVSHLGTLRTLLCQHVAIKEITGENSNIYQFNLDTVVNDENLDLLLNQMHFMMANDIFK